MKKIKKNPPRVEGGISWDSLSQKEKDRLEEVGLETELAVLLHRQLKKEREETSSGDHSDG